MRTTHTTAKDLIHKLLNPDPIERYTIDEALAHSWLRGVVSCLFYGSGWCLGRSRLCVGVRGAEDGVANSDSKRRNDSTAKARAGGGGGGWWWRAP